MQIEAILTPRGQLEVELTARATIEAELRGGAGGVPEYRGAYEVTPTQATQTLYTHGFQMAQNVIINPIPSNYGLITWNGATLTVS